MESNGHLWMHANVRVVLIAQERVTRLIPICSNGDANERNMPVISLIT